MSSTARREADARTERTGNGHTIANLVGRRIRRRKGGRRQSLSAPKATRRQATNDAAAVALLCVALFALPASGGCRPSGAGSCSCRQSYRPASAPLRRLAEACGRQSRRGRRRHQPPQVCRRNCRSRKTSRRRDQLRIHSYSATCGAGRDAPAAARLAAAAAAAAESSQRRCRCPKRRTITFFLRRRAAYLSAGECRQVCGAGNLAASSHSRRRVRLAAHLRGARAHARRALRRSLARAQPHASGSSLPLLSLCVCVFAFASWRRRANEETTSANAEKIRPTNFAAPPREASRANTRCRRPFKCARFPAATRRPRRRAGATSSVRTRRQ